MQQENFEQKIDLNETQLKRENILDFLFNSTFKDALESNEAISVGKNYLNKLIDTILENLDKENNMIVKIIESGEEFQTVLEVLDKMHGENGKNLLIGKMSKFVDYIKERLGNN